MQTAVNSLLVKCQLDDVSVDQLKLFWTSRTEFIETLEICFLIC